MSKEIKLQVPDSLFSLLNDKARGQGVSIETLCLSLLQPEEPLIDPVLYMSMSNGQLRAEINKVLHSGLPESEVRKRVRTLETQITRFIK